MTSADPVPFRAHPQARGPWNDARKVTAFLRRDFLTAWSYRTAFFTDALALITQALVFAYVSQLVDPSRVPSFGGTRTGYLTYVTIGIAVSAFLTVGLGRLNAAIHTERYIGTLESVLVTPTRMGTLQLGWLAYDTLYVPVRTVVFVALMALVFDLPLQTRGTALAVLFVLALLPFVWGIAAAAAAASLVFRRVGAITGVGAFALTFTSGAYFPLDLFPAWVSSVAVWNPVAIAVAGARRALLGGEGLAALTPPLLALFAWGAVVLTAGLRLFSRGMRHELRKGGIGLY